MSPDISPFFDHEYEVTPDPDTPQLYRYMKRSSLPHAYPESPHEKVEELITALLKKRPDWVFTIHTAESKSLQIYTEDKEHLGSVEYYPESPYAPSRAYFQLHNFRIAAETSGPSGGRCYSVAKASERIVAKFRPMTPKELAQQRKECAEAKAETVARKARSTWLVSGRQGKMIEIGRQVLNNPEPYLDTPISPLIEELHPHWIQQMAAAPYADTNNFEIVTEIEQNGVRQLYNITKAPECYWLDAEQHRELISKVALLRMVDVGEVVAEVGFRSADHTYVLLS
jgi:hypothetical protein